MRIALALTAALVVAGVSSVSFAADHAAPRGQVSQNALADMGLGEMQVLSDHDGTSVRGKAAWLAWFGPIQPFNTGATGNYIINQGLAAVVHFPDFKGFYVAPSAF